MKNIICFLTVTPSASFYNFAKTLKNSNYDVFICIDNNNYNIPNYDRVLPIIKINNTFAEAAGFKNSVLYFKNKACARDKALYYFSKCKIPFDKLWLIEEDVFIPTNTVISNIDSKYKHADLLTAPEIKTVYKYSDLIGWHWDQYKHNIFLPLPWANSMICAIRISRNLLASITEYVRKNKILFIDEALFNTISIHNNHFVLAIEELKTIHYRADWTIDKIDKNHLYHPIKDTNVHTQFRNILNKN